MGGDDEQSFVEKQSVKREIEMGVVSVGVGSRNCQPSVECPGRAGHDSLSYYHTLVVGWLVARLVKNQPHYDTR